MQETQGGGTGVPRSADVKGKKEDEIARIDRDARRRYVRHVVCSIYDDNSVSDV